MNFAQIPLFKGLTDAEARAVLDISEELSLAVGSALFHEGDAGDAIYAVLDGELDVHKRANGTQQLLARVGPGAVLGEMSLVSGGTARTASAVAASPVRLLKLSATRFRGLLEKDSVPALKIISNLAQVMSQRLQAANEKLVELSGRTQRKEELVDFQRILSHWSF